MVHPARLRRTLGEPNRSCRFQFQGVSSRARLGRNNANPGDPHGYTPDMDSQWMRVFRARASRAISLSVMVFLKSRLRRDSPGKRVIEVDEIFLCIESSRIAGTNLDTLRPRGDV